MNLKKALVCLALTASYYQVKSQNEQWVVPPMNYNMNAPTPTSAAIPGGSTTSTSPTNGAYDASGHLLFYVRDMNLYSANSTLVGKLPTPVGGGTSFGPEVEIVPIPGKEDCNKFYVIYMCGGILYAEVDCNTTGNPTMIPAPGTILPNTSSPNYLFSDIVIQGLAVSKLTSSGVRYLFTLATDDPHDDTRGGLYRFTIGSTNISKTYVLAATDRQLSYPYMDPNKCYFQFSLNNAQCYQLSLSADQTHLGWGGATNGIAAMQTAFDLQLNNYMLVPGSYAYYALNGSFSDYGVSGAVYDASDRLWASTQSSIYVVTPGNQNVAQVPGSHVLTVNSMSSYYGSQLEYVPSSNLIVGVTPTATNGTGKFFSVNPNTFGFNPNYMSGQVKTTFNGVLGIFCLPDQIDGDVINYASLTPSVNVVTSQICAGNPIVVNGTYTSVGNITPNSYSWEIDQCTDQYGNNPTPVWSGTYTSSPGNPFTIPGSNTLACGTYYKITYSIQNTTSCTSMATASAMVLVGCVDHPIIAGNTSVCSGSTTILTSNYTNSSHNAIVWTSGGTSLGSGTSITVPSTSATYTLTATFVPSGCPVSTSVTITPVNNIPSFNLSDNTSLSGYATISAIASDIPTTQTAGYGYEYILEELSSTGSTNWIDNDNPCYWWNYPFPTTFNLINNAPPQQDYTSNLYFPVACPTGLSPGNQCTQYPAGEFAYGNTYRITLGSWNNACPWAQSSQTITLPLTGGRLASPSILRTATAPDYSHLPGQQSIEKVNVADQENDSFRATLYPNPSSGSFTIETPFASTQLVEVYDLTGKLVLSTNILGTTSIDAGTLPAGIYNVKLSNGDHVVNKRIVISK